MISKLVGKSTYASMIDVSCCNYVAKLSQSEKDDMRGLILAVEVYPTAERTGRCAMFRVDSCEPCHSESGMKTFMRLRLLAAFEEET